MKAGIGIAMLVTMTECATVALSAQEAKLAADQSVAGASAANDNMTPYRTLATETLQAFRSHDMPAAKKKARELEVAWDTHEKALQKKSPDLWGQIDKAMDVFIKPVLQEKSPDAAKIQTAYDAFLAKLELAVNGAAESQR